MKNYDELLAERDALSAHLHNLHEALKAFSNVKAPGGFARDTREYDKAMGKCWQNLWTVVNTAPEQALLAVKAEAGRAGFVAGFGESDSWVNGEVGAPNSVVLKMAEEYASKIRKGEL